LLLTVIGCLIHAPTAGAVVQFPTTIDGPSPAVVEFGGVAMAADGTGGLVYTKVTEGVPHVFAARYDGNSWSAPVRVDRGESFTASQAAIAAGVDGRLLVVWVTPVATVESRIRYGLYAATAGEGSSGFGEPLLVDPNVGNGVGVDPAVAGASAGKAIVAYRVITNDFTRASAGTTAVQQRPGDVLAEVRLARLSGERWSRLGAINRTPTTSMRSPTVANGPRVGIDANGNAVVAWQEPDQSGVSRIWLRRIYGSTIGPPIEATPATWEGQPVTGEADAFSLAVTSFAQARLVSRIEPGGAFGSPRVMLSTLGPNYSEAGAKLSGPVLADGGVRAAGIGWPAVGVSGANGAEGEVSVAFASGGNLIRLGGPGSSLVERPALGAPPPIAEAEVMTGIDPEGGGVVAYSTVDALGNPAVAVRQEFPSGELQEGLLGGEAGGPISQLSGATLESGDALIGFRQGSPGNYEIVGDRVSAPPSDFTVRGPGRWVRPGKATLRWTAAPSAVGGVTYAVVIDGRTVRRGLSGLRFTPPKQALGSGRINARVLATDALGGQALTKASKLKVDSEPPTASAKVRQSSVTVKLIDRDSGVRSGTCSFGDGTKPIRSRRLCKHTYSKPGTYTILVHAWDRVGNGITRHLRVTIR
jgi:hypothetical protein